MSTVSGAGLEVIRRFNNNVIEAVDEQGRRIVATGKGIGFQAAAGTRIDPERIEVRYLPDTDANVARVLATLADVSPEISRLARIATLEAQQRFGMSGSTAFEIALADHLAGAVDRALKRQRLSFPLAFEVRQLYPTELAFGEYVVALVHARLGVQLETDEACALALHAVNDHLTRGAKSVAHAVDSTAAIEAALQCIEEHSGRRIPRRDASTTRLVTHLRYLLRRLLQPHTAKPICPPAVLAAIQTSLAGSWPIAEHVAAVLGEAVDTTLDESEVAYLALHVGRLLGVSDRPGKQ